MTMNMLDQPPTFSLVKSRLAPGSPGWSFFFLFVTMPEMAQYTSGCWLPPSDHIQSETLFQTRQQDQEREMNGPASLLHGWHWVQKVATDNSQSKSRQIRTFKIEPRVVLVPKNSWVLVEKVGDFLGSCTELMMFLSAWVLLIKIDCTVLQLTLLWK